MSGIDVWKEINVVELVDPQEKLLQETVAAVNRLHMRVAVLEKAE